MTEVHNVRSSLKLCKEQGRVYRVKVKKIPCSIQANEYGTGQS